MVKRRLLYSLCILWPALFFAQQDAKGGYTADASYFYGNIIPHRKSIQHLITSHPTGLLISFNKKTFGKEQWEQSFNYPDYGVSLQYQDMQDSALGFMYGIYGHYNFYFFKRNVVLRVGQGVAYNTNPYDKVTNFRNYAYGVHFMPSTYFMLNYSRQNLWQGMGVNAGLMFIHHSNASIKAPNTSTNTLAVNVGLNYTFDKNEGYVYTTKVLDSVIAEPIHLTAILRGGVNQSDIIGSSQYGYYTLGAYAGKRISRKSGFQLGAEFFWPQYLKEYIKYKSIAYPEENVDGSTDYRKLGLFTGYELFINRLSLEGQVGYYVYSPFNSTGKLYQRVGAKYYVTPGVSGSIGLKTHGAKAEVMEFGLAIRVL